MENKKWIVICIIGGLLMFISSIVGSVSFYALVFSVVSGILGPVAAATLSIVLLVFTYIALGGGISVIIGAIIVALGSYGIGKFIIALGAGMGLIGLIIFLITSILAGSVISSIIGLILQILNGSYGFLGVLLTIIARMRLKKSKPTK